MKKILKYEISRGNETSIFIKYVVNSHQKDFGTTGEKFFSSEGYGIYNYPLNAPFEFPTANFPKFAQAVKEYNEFTFEDEKIIFTPVTMTINTKEEFFGLLNRLNLNTIDYVKYYLNRRGKFMTDTAIKEAENIDVTLMRIFNECMSSNPKLYNEWYAKFG